MDLLKDSVHEDGSDLPNIDVTIKLSVDERDRVKDNAPLAALLQDLNFVIVYATCRWYGIIGTSSS